MLNLIDGKKIANEIRNEISQQVHSIRDRGIVPHLTVILVGEDPASQVYVKNKGKACEKVGISSETLKYPANIKQDDLIQIIKKLNQNPKIHGILVQLPLPDHINEKEVLYYIAPEKDVDGMHPVNAGKLALGMDNGFVPCTPNGILELLMRTKNYPEGKHVVIVGRSNLVGKPLGLLLLKKKKNSGNATVTFCHSRSTNLSEVTKSADILVVAVGRLNTITKDMVRPGTVVIDVGVNRIPDKSSPKGTRLVGDVNFEEISNIAGAITPVPGGVGPMTITMLLKNTLIAAERGVQS